MKKTCLLLAAFIGMSAAVFAFEGQKPLEIGAKAPDFDLPGIDGKNYTLASFKSAKVLAIVFICNHCPTAQAYEGRIKKITSDYAARGVAVVAINPNNPNSLRLDELGWSDVGDSFEDMKVRAKDKAFNFVYLYDGETEAVSRQYGPIATPHIFIFDKDRVLRYNGRIDDMENPSKTPNTQDARNAIDAVLAGKPIATPVTKVFGCSVKWLEKNDWIEKAKTDWAKEPVSIELIDAEGIAKLLKNDSDKVRLINVWATWCGPCVVEFPEFIRFNRMYRDRDFEFVSISADIPENKDKVLKFLQKKQASNTNYLYNSDDKYKLIEAIDPNWQGALPYTILVEPGGKITYAKQATIDVEELNKMIFNSATIGRLYKD